MENLLKINGLRVHFDTLDGPIEALHSVSLSVNEGQIMGVVGESGCGKSVTSLVTIGLASCEVDEGSVVFDGKELIHKAPESTSRTLSKLKLISSFSALGIVLSLFFILFNPDSGIIALGVLFLVFAASSITMFLIDTPSREHRKFLRSVRGNKISMIFQEPMTALNPLYTVEKQVAEVLREHGKLVDAQTPTSQRIVDAILSPIYMLIVALKSRAGIQLLGTFFLIFLTHQNGYADFVIDLLIAPISAFTDPLISLLRGFHESLGNYPNVLQYAIIGITYFTALFLSLIVLNVLGRYINSLRQPSNLDLFRILDNIWFNLPLIVVTYVVVFILLWIPFGAFVAIIGFSAILTVPPIQISTYYNLDPAHTQQVVEILKEVRIPNPEAVVKMYPHELSGGMRQRVMIAMMMACEPKLLIADEPTTALDVTIQAQILSLMKDLRDREGTAIMMITHDLGVIAEICDAVSVMYAGSVVETGSLEQILGSPRMPYTIGLLHSIPRIKEEGEARSDLPIIPGQVPDPNEEFDGCRFHPRCPFADETCRTTPPPMQEVSPGHFASCHHTDQTVDLDTSQQAFSVTEFLQSGVST